MALIVENGAMTRKANTYAALAEADAWLGARGFASWPQPSVDQEIIARKEAALIRATDYLNGLGWNGKKAAEGRIMAWPRLEALDADGRPIASNAVPPQVKAATCYLAGQIYNGVEAQPVLERGGRIASESVGGLSTSFFDDAPGRDVFSALADLARPSQRF